MAFNNNISPEHAAMIDRFLEGKASLEERSTVEELLLSDAGFKKEMEETKILHTAIASTALASRMEEWHNKIDTRQENKRASRKYPFQKIAIITGIAAAILWGTFSVLDFSDPMKRIYDKNFVPDPGLPTVMGTSDEYAFNKAMVAYKSGEYKTAIDSWELLRETNKNSDTLNYFIGVAYLALRDDTQAVSYLERASKKSNSIFQIEMNHYLGMAYLQAGNLDLAREYLGKSKLPESRRVLDELSDL